MNEYYDQKRCWIEIDLQALEHNVNQLLKLMKSKEQFMAVIKADGYGHGAVLIGKKLNQLGINHFAVATLAEAMTLRECGIKGEILILGYTNPAMAYQIKEYQLIQSVIDYQYARLLNEQHIDIQVHLVVDSGMHRLGHTIDEIDDIKAIYGLSYLHVCGIYSHLCVADDLSIVSQNYTRKQISTFFDMIDQLQSRGFDVGKIHLQSSYGLLNYSYLDCDYVRIGISLYGVQSSKDDQIRLDIDLQPVLSLKAKVALIHDIQENETIGYGRTYKSQKKEKIAVIPIGYADGLPRCLSNQGQVIIRGQIAPIVGRICMDQMMVDVTDIDHVQCDDIVTIIGQDGKNIQKVETIAYQAQTISNEILCRLGHRIPRIVKGDYYEV